MAKHSGILREGKFLIGLKCVSLCLLIFSDITFAVKKLWNYYCCCWCCAYYHCYHRPCRHCYVRCDHVIEPSISIKSMSVLTSKDISSRSRRAMLPGVSLCLFYQYLSGIFAKHSEMLSLCEFFACGSCHIYSIFFLYKLLQITFFLPPLKPAFPESWIILHRAPDKLSYVRHSG